MEHSPGLARRAGQLAAYLSALHAALEPELAPDGLRPVGLWVLSAGEWERRARVPYGFTFYRRLKDGRGVVVAPGDYPGRLLRVFREVVVRAERAGAPVPGAVPEFLDLTLGHELGHALADQLGLVTRVRWLDEFLATYLYLAALEEALPAQLPRVVAWGRAFEAASPRDCALADAALGLPQKAGAARRDLGAFEFPLVRLPLANQAWYQARFTLRAAELLERRGLGFPRELLTALGSGRGRGSVHRTVLQLEPSFRDWFASFGEAV